MSCPDAKTEVSAALLAGALGLSRKRVEQLAAEGVIPAAPRGSSSCSRA